MLAAKLRYEIEAEGTRLMNEAHNMLEPDARISALRMRVLEKLEGIIRESVKPLEKIEGIKILQVTGLGGAGEGNGKGAAGITDEVLNSALRYRVQAPLIDQVLKEIGLQGGGGDVARFTDNLMQLRRADVRKAAEERPQIEESGEKP